jgi:hypothetical protein
MIHIKFSKNIKNSSPQNLRNFITSDETWAFTEQPKKEMPANGHKHNTPHDLFNLFTAEIIRKKTIFIR